MPKKNENFSIEQAKQLASTPAGQQLIALLRSTGGSSLAEAQRHAASGNMEQAKASLAELLRSEKVQQLLKEMENRS